MAGLSLGLLPGLFLVLDPDLDGGGDEGPLLPLQTQIFVGPFVELMEAIVGDVGFRVALPDQFFASSTSSWKVVVKPQTSWTFST